MILRVLIAGFSCKFIVYRLNSKHTHAKTAEIIAKTHKYFCHKTTKFQSSAILLIGFFQKKYMRFGWGDQIHLLPNWYEVETESLTRIY